MSTRAAVALFAGKLIGIYVALAIIPWPGWQEACSETVAGVVNYFSSDVWGGLEAMTEGRGIFGTSAAAQVKSIARGAPEHGVDADIEHDLLIAVANLDAINRKIPPPTPKRADSMLLAIAPLSFLFALIVATPMTWKRRMIALASGGIACCVFILLRFSILIVVLFYGAAPHHVIKPTDLWNAVLPRVSGFLTETMATSFLVPLLIWVVVAFRRSDLERVVQWLALQAGDERENAETTGKKHDSS